MEGSPPSRRLRHRPDGAEWRVLPFSAPHTSTLIAPALTTPWHDASLAPLANLALAASFTRSVLSGPQDSRSRRAHRPATLPLRSLEPTPRERRRFRVGFEAARRGARTRRWRAQLQSQDAGLPALDACPARGRVPRGRVRDAPSARARREHGPRASSGAAPRGPQHAAHDHRGRRLLRARRREAVERGGRAVRAAREERGAGRDVAPEPVPGRALRGLFSRERLPLRARLTPNRTSPPRCTASATT